MTRLEKAAGPKATLARRAVWMGAAAIGLAACEPAMRVTASTTPALDVDGLMRAMDDIAETARPGVLGVAFANLESGQRLTFNGARPFPMQSVFKAPLAAAVLAEVDEGHVRLDETIVLLEEQLSPAFSPIAAAWPERRAYSVRELLEAVIVTSDNTAADVLMKRIGGPGAVTAWLANHRVREVRIDRYERELQPEIYGMPSFRPAWREPYIWAAAQNAVPPAERMRAMRRHLADPRDTATPRGMLDFLQMLDREELVSAASTRRLMALMSRTKPGAGRIRAGLPKDAFLAHRPGTSGVDQGLSTAHNDVGVFTLPDRRSYALAVFLSGSTLDAAGRDRIIAQVAAAAVRAAG